MVLSTNPLSYAFTNGVRELNSVGDYNTQESLQLLGEVCIFDFEDCKLAGRKLGRSKAESGKACFGVRFRGR